MTKMGEGRRALMGQYWEDVNNVVGKVSPRGCEDRGVPFEPKEFARALDQRALTYSSLADDDSLAPWQRAAAGSAAILDQEHAAQVRFAAGLPTLRPATEKALLHLDETVCQACGRAWQLDPTGACPTCPRIRFGHPEIADESQSADTTRAVIDAFLRECLSADIGGITASVISSRLPENDHRPTAWVVAELERRVQNPRSGEIALAHRDPRLGVYTILEPPPADAAEDR